VSILKEVLVEELQDLLHAENQLTKALPKMARAAKSAELKSAFEQHTEQTKVLPLHLQGMPAGTC
jgi:ferritin-like metal-binding protein YciE